MERLSEHTARLAAQSRDVPWLALCWLCDKHIWNRHAIAAEALRFQLVTRALDKITKAAVSVGTPGESGWASELTAFQSIAADWVTANQLTKFYPSSPIGAWHSSRRRLSRTFRRP